MSTPPPSRPKTYFERTVSIFRSCLIPLRHADHFFRAEQREILLTDISLALENVLTGLNTLNRGIEGVVSVGKELEGVETLWRQFEKGVMEGQGANPAAEEQGGESAGKEGRS
ncbi:hypothetical protein BJ508DRAFT_372480 [Ascobolus immersus RN42]|uniref:DASH complex subunit DAD1 n=1 Tax=Ascobolus immersus RN42 TaxID=1160509 RepID=A0A3N4IM08_ASCIM|nr:hypothetical protein BJ508DRAFT_372480 [Ascobolus immersus RN42]